MNINIYKNCYDAAKREFHRSITRIMLARMVSQNIRDIVPDWIKIEPYSSSLPQFIKLTPLIEVDAQRFDNFVTKFSKKIGKKPSVNISDEFEAHWYLYPRMNNRDFYETICIEFTTANIEKCDVTYRDITIQAPVLTGYCKALAEKYQ